MYKPVGISDELMSNASDSLLFIGEYLGDANFESDAFVWRLCRYLAM
jgi:hypothetical protein